MSAPDTASPSPTDGRVHFTRDGAVAHLVFDRPTARNAMSWRMYEEMALALAAIAADPAIRVAVLRGAGGRAFVAGTDIEQFRGFSGEDGLAYEAKVEHYMRLLEQVPVPTVAVVEGWAVGGGMAIANACDFRLATPGARFGVPISRTLGNCLSSANLRRLVATLGLGMVRRMLLAAETPTAEEMPPGYVAIHPAEELDAAVDALCARLAAHAPLTLRVTKQMLDRLAHQADADDTDLVREIYGSADFREGVESFLAKRPAQWRGA